MASDKHNHHVLRTLLRWANWTLLALALIFVALAAWIRHRFGDVSFDQVITNLPIGPGKGIGNNGLAVEVAVWCIGAPIALVVAIALLTRRFRGGLGTRRPVRLIPVASLVIGFSVFLTVAGVPQYAMAELSEQTIAPYYVKPAVTSTPTKPKNLVTIYLESGENTYGDADVVGEDLLTNLDDATADGWTNYQGLHQFEGGGWTMAGFVSTQCGIPLKSQLVGQGGDFNIFGEDVDHYLPGATCLGNVLEDHGYQNVYVGGADDEFAGKDTFLTDHGFSKVMGLADWKNDPEDADYISEAWGLSDSHMLKHAADVLDKLHASGKPFSLSMITLDTHEPPGIYPDCQDGDPTPMATAIKCSMKAVATFLQHIKQAGYLDDTVVMIMGDHLKGTSDNDAFHDALRAQQNRTIVFRVWSPDGEVQFNRENADQLSVLPTTLELLGFGLEDGRAGLGVSLIGNHDLAGTALALDDQEYRVMLRAPSTEIYQQFWAPPQ